jgi:hypothetical protein
LLSICVLLEPSVRAPRRRRRGGQPADPDGNQAWEGCRSQKHRTDGSPGPIFSLPRARPAVLATRRPRSCRRWLRGKPRRFERGGRLRRQDPCGRTCAWPERSLRPRARKDSAPVALHAGTAPVSQSRKRAPPPVNPAESSNSFRLASRAPTRIVDLRTTKEERLRRRML